MSTYPKYVNKPFVESALSVQLSLKTKLKEQIQESIDDRARAWKQRKFLVYEALTFEQVVLEQELKDAEMSLVKLHGLSCMIKEQSATKE